MIRSCRPCGESFLRPYAFAFSDADANARGSDQSDLGTELDVREFPDAMSVLVSVLRSQYQ
jgi:hypothetical protein